ncbi:DUF2163 domain-containing protein [Notoacmeibacter sp. MSK16QG-6]|uniref:DUF2163 domain-containing protein n=1 Tax=Notoacmeibacter sp. MSK16QG-6 TaxID=2957982 RepID=UPI0020A0DB4C|nr:DUF2163 domain-containing protein [Notoacmeibacter sp. MSK16QG-6]MCP1198126.1 DUF2163 domain-containing protein [Notoacmeibacter sp. MSK16QG-6]
MSDGTIELGGAQATRLCNCWRLICLDGMVIGFTDTDQSLSFDGTVFEPGSGLNASEVRESSGLAVDSSDVEGVLSAASITSDDVRSGRFDGAVVETWLVDWSEPAARRLLRRATIGEISLQGGRFVASLESAAAPLDKPQGRFVRRSCDAELGDRACKVDLDDPRWHETVDITGVGPERCISIDGGDDFPGGWFEGGLVLWTEGNGRHRSARIRHETADADQRVLELDGNGSGPAEGTRCTLVAGCDKMFRTCREKFANHLNYRGFPHLPGNDVAYTYVVRGVMPLDGKPVVTS